MPEVLSKAPSEIAMMVSATMTSIKVKPLMRLLIKGVFIKALNDDEDVKISK